MYLIQSWPGHEFSLEAIFACACERWLQVQLTPVSEFQEQSKKSLPWSVGQARPSSTEFKDKWAVEISRDCQRTRTLKFPDLEVGSVLKDYDFHLVCRSKTIWNTWMLYSLTTGLLNLSRRW